METFFKIIFFLAIIVFCLMIIGFFLLFLKISLLFTPEIHIFGITVT